MSTTSLPLFETRREAHDQVTPKKKQVYDRILSFARHRGNWGFTADELAQEWQCPHNHTSPRISELVRRGELLATKRRRRTRAGSWACVFVIADLSTEGQRRG